MIITKAKITEIRQRAFAAKRELLMSHGSDGYHDDVYGFIQDIKARSTAFECSHEESLNAIIKSERPSTCEWFLAAYAEIEGI